MQVAFDEMVDGIVEGEVEEYTFRLFNKIPVPGVKPKVGDKVLVNGVLRTIVWIKF